MKGERIATVGPYEVGAEGVKRIIETLEEDEHVMVGIAKTPEEIRKLATLTEKPTVIIVQDFTRFETAVSAVRMAKDLIPKVEVITFGVDQVIEEADHQLGIMAGRRELKEILLNLKH